MAKEHGICDKDQNPECPRNFNGRSGLDDGWINVRNALNVPMLSNPSGFPSRISCCLITSSEEKSVN